MDVFAYRLLRDFLGEAGEIIAPLRHACRSHAHLYAFFHGFGWELREALGVDLAGLRAHVESAYRALQAIRGAVDAGDETAVALAARDAFKDSMERAKPLYGILMAARPLPVTDSVLQEFAEDLALYLATLYLARRARVVFQIGMMAGIIRKEWAQPLFATDSARTMLRYPVERLLVRPLDAIWGALNPALSLLSEFRQPEGLLERLRMRLDSEAQRVLDAAGGQGLEGLEIRLDPNGIRMSGGKLPVPAVGGAPIRIPIDLPGSPVVAIGPGGWALTWGDRAAPDGILHLFETAGVKFFIPGRPAAGGSAASLTLLQEDGRIRVDIVGGIGIGLPSEILTGADGDEIRASACLRFSYRQGDEPIAGLEEIRLQGRFHIGGAGGLLVEEAEVILSNLEIPPPVPTPARPLPFDLKVKGRLLFGEGDFRLEIEAGYGQGVWTLSSTGEARFPNGMEMRPVDGKPVFSAQLDTGTGSARMAAAGEIRFPREGGAAGLRAEGELAIRMAGGALKIERFACAGRAVDWPLAAHVAMRTLSIRLGYENGRITAVVAAVIPLGGGFIIEILEKAPAGAGVAAAPSGLTLVEAGGVLTAVFSGGVRIAFPAGVLTSSGNAEPIVAEAGGVLTLSSDPQVPPSLASLSLSLSAKRLHLGGDKGLILEDASLAATDVDRFFVPGRAPFAALTLSGTVICPIESSQGRLTFGMKGARFTFRAPDRLPEFDFLDGGGLSIANAAPAGIPLEITSASISLKAGGPLPEALRPDNIGITMGARITADFGDMAGAVGGIDKITADIREGRPHVVLEGAHFGVEDLTLPPMRFSGALGIHNLHEPLNLRLEGILGGSVQGAAVKALVALRLEQGRPEPVGVCLDVNLGPAGISIAYGFTIQGISGGLSFANTNGDPCAFATYSGAGLPLRTGSRAPAGNPKPGSGCGCDCPPASLNILCQPHPDQDLHSGRAILKFSALEEGMWAGLPVPLGDGRMVSLGEMLDRMDGEIRAELAGRAAGLDLRARAADAAGKVALAAKSMVAGMIPSLDPSILRPRPTTEALAAFDALSDVFLRPADYWARETASRLSDELGSKLISLASGESVPPLRSLVAAQLYRGVNCPDTTLQVTGSFSYVGVSSFAYVSGGVNVSTAGSVGVIGTLTVFGVPFGKLKAFVTATDTQGNPEPSVCGSLMFEMGPVRFGQLCLEYRIPGAVTNFADVLSRFGHKLGKPLVARILDRIKHEARPFAARPGFDIETDLKGSLARLEPAEAAQFIADLMSCPGLTGDQARLAMLFASELARDLWSGFNPEVNACGEVAPEIFGLKLANLAQAKARITKERIEAEISFSPMYLLGRVFPFADIFSGMDSARLGAALTFPRIEALVAEGLVAHFQGQANFDSILEKGLARILRESTFTLSYRLFPLGLRLIDMQGRLVMPYLTPHPEALAARWANPDSPRPGAILPTRRAALFAALDAERLADITWSGALEEVLPLPPSRQDLQLQRDYFPHGGMLGAGKFFVPRLLWDAPPLDLLAQGLRSRDWGERLRTLITLVKDWVLATRQAGTMAFYVPAPNLPAGLLNATDIPVRNMVEAIAQSNPALFDAEGRLTNSVGYPLHLAFFEGAFKGRLLGTAIGKGEIFFTPPPPAGGNSRLRIRARADQDPRLSAWIETAELEFDMISAPDAAADPRQKQTVEDRFSFLLTQLEAGRLSWSGTGEPPQSVKTLAEDAAQAFAAHLPKVSLDANVALRIPPRWSDWLSLASAGARLSAFSPCYDASATGTAPLDIARRDGGWRLAAELRFKFAEALRCTASADCLMIFPVSESEPARLKGEASITSVDPFQILGAQVRMGRARLSIDTGAGPGQAVLSLAGATGPLQLGGILVEPLGTPDLEVELQARRGAQAPEAVLLISPARLRMPGLDPATSLEIRPEDGHAKARLGAAKVIAPKGIKLIGPAGRSALELGGTITGRFNIATGLPSLDLSLPAGLRITLFPDEPLFRRTAVLAEAMEFRVKADGTFLLRFSLPPLDMDQGLFRLHGNAGTNAPLAMTITEREARLDAAARLTVSPPGAPSSGMVLEHLVLSPVSFTAGGAASSVSLAGLAEIQALRFAFAHTPAGFELSLDGARLRFEHLPGFAADWNVKLRRNRMEAMFAGSGSAVCAFGTRLTMSASDWRISGSLTNLEIAANGPKITLLGFPVAAGPVARVSLTAQSAVAGIVFGGNRLALLPNLMEIQPDRADIVWGAAGGRVKLSGKLFMMPRLDQATGWLVERSAAVDLDLDDFRIDGLVAQVQMFARNGLAVHSDFGIGRDGQGCYLSVAGVSVACLGVSLPVMAGRIGANGQLNLSWTKSDRIPIGPFGIESYSFSLSIQTSTRWLIMRLGGMRISAQSAGWLHGQAALPEVKLSWSAGTPIPDRKTAVFNAKDSEAKIAGAVGYRITGPKVQVAIDFGAGPFGLALVSMDLFGATLRVETVATKPDGSPWASLSQSLPNRSIGTDGSFSIAIPALDAGMDPFSASRSTCQDKAKTDFPLPSFPNPPPDWAGPVAWETYRQLKRAYDKAKTRLAEGLSACEIAFPMPPAGARTPGASITVKLQDLFRFL